jgi:5-methylcytosine-specific restriction endonuclease McrA
VSVKNEINNKIDKLKKENKDFNDLKLRESQYILCQSLPIYESIKPIFDFWPKYPPDWKERSTSRIYAKSRKCEKCKNSLKILHVHHIIPLSQGGNHKKSNLIVLCADCHKENHGVKQFTGRNDSKVRNKTIKNNEIINMAIKYNKAIQFKYRKSDGEVSYRSINPTKIVMVKNSKCVRGFCHLRNEERTFKISRISFLKVSEDARNK